MSSRKRWVVVYIGLVTITLLFLAWLNGFLSPVMYKYFGTTVEATGNPPSYPGMVASTT